MALSSPSRSAPARPAATPALRPLRSRLAEFLPVLALVALAAVLRLYRLSYAEYRGDDDDMVTAATAALQHGWLQSHGLISSVPVDNGPVAMWLLLLPLAVASSLLVAQVWVALLNLGAVALCYGVVRLAWNRRLALVATALYAVSPWAVIYARRLWITAFDAPLALLAFWSLLAWLRASAAPVNADGPIWREGLAQRYRSALGGYLPPLLCGLAFSAFFQAHVVPLGEVVTLLLVLLGCARLLGWRRVLVALATLAATLAPYVLTTVLPALGKTLAGQQARHPDVDGLSWFFFGHLVTGRGFQSIVPQSSRLLDATEPFFTALDWLAVAFLAAGALTTLLSLAVALRGGKAFAAARAAVLLLWALVPPLGLMLHLVEVHPYYFVVSMPAIYVLEGVGLLTAAKMVGEGLAGLGPGDRRSGRPTWPIVAFTGVLVAAQLALALPFFLVLPEYWSAADYGLPLASTQELVAKALHYGAGTLTVVGGYDHDVDYTLYSTLGRATSGARYADDRGILEYATAGPALLYLTTDDQSWEAEALQASFAASELDQVRLLGQGKTFRYFRPQAAAVQAWARLVAPPLPVPHQFGDVASLNGATIEGATAGGTLHVWLDWRLLRDPPQPMLMQLELVGSDGYVWDRGDAVSYPAGYWHAGDAARVAFVNRLDLPLPVYLPPGTYGVRVRLVGIADGRQIGDPVTVGSLALDRLPAPAAVPASLPNPGALPVAPGLTLAGWQADQSQVQQGASLGVVLYWRITGSVAALPAVQLRAAGGDVLATVQHSDLGQSFPPAQWPVGALLADRRRLSIGGRVAPGEATVTLLPGSSAAVPLGVVTIAPLPRVMTLPPIANPLEVRFGQDIRLAGFDLTPDQPRAGGSVLLTLVWLASGPPSGDETAFVHLVDAGGNLVAQADGPPGGTAMPTSVWEPGQAIVDVHRLTLPPTLPAGRYHLQVGLYALASGARLPASGPDLAEGGTALDLGAVEVQGR